MKNTKTNIKNNKTKTATTIISALVIGLVLLSPTTIIPNVSAQEKTQLTTPSDQTVPESPCTESVIKQTEQRVLSLDNEKAKSLAFADSKLQSSIKGYSATFNSIFNTGSWNSTCIVTWQTANVVYTLNDTKGYAKSVIVTEDPSLRKVIGISEQIGKVYGNNANWSGYEFYALNGGNYYNVWEAKSTWIVPSISQPYSGACTTSTPCDAAVWAGLEDSANAADNYIAQGGSDSTCTNGSTCSATNTLWYQFLGQGPATTCSSVSVSAGNSITSDVNDTTRNPLATSSNYVITVTNNANSQVCGTGTSGNNFDMNNDLYAAFIVERAKNIYNSNQNTLAQFDSIPMTSKMYYNGALQNVYTPYTNSWYVQDNMYNSGNTNIILGTPNGGGTFYQYWNTSSGT